MKTKLTYLILLVATISFNGCKKDKELPKQIPIVTTGTATAIGLTSVTVMGSISSDGNSPVTSTGFVYSSNVALPTNADNKKELTDTEGDFTAIIEGLSSGTTYHIRAYAINGVGTAYGEVINYTTGNAGPLATNVAIVGTVEVSKTLTANYTYFDAENNLEGATEFQWYAATSATGANEMAIVGATAKTFVVQEAQNGKFLRVSITPKATLGTLDGAEAKSVYTGAVGAETVTFTYNGIQVTYGTIISQKTGKKWLDRNLGASRVAQTIDDYQAAGDLFQWGRRADGHQKVVRTGTTAADITGVTGISSTTSSQDAPSTDRFITDNGISGDWRNPFNNSLWQGVNGINNPCPAGWRVAAKAEWDAEAITSSADGFQKLKLPYTGLRWYNNGTFDLMPHGIYWTSTTETQYAPQIFSYNVFLENTGYFSDPGNRGNGHACKCIKE